MDPMDRLDAELVAPLKGFMEATGGGFNFQLLKRLVCRPVPRTCIVRMGNCSATLVRLRDVRGTFMGELIWHVPVELMGGQSLEGVRV